MPRTIVITGGGTGIGRACAERFAREGEHVIITGRRRSVLEATAREVEGDIVVRPVDGTDSGQVERFAEQLEAVDVLINNAGGNTDFERPRPASLADIAAAWHANLDANLLSAVLMTSALLPSMRENGRILSIGSIAADKGAESYGAAKAGIASWNIGLAREVGARAITANVVSPGYIADTEFFGDNLTDERRASLIDAAMTKRAGAPEDIAETIWFLASAGAGQITGQTFAVNGGEQPTR
ncbi:MULTISPECIES: SDR family NAD(P)-dependent oxidoreductase [Brevibacterium]|uniref:3-oxoacyl-ACP reductase n=2 Tax=Actinomycetes TaxID=1760 RepID=A0A163AUA6_9MICO|nr:SDR family oxidoreductase [Brevibacterium casei]NJE65679.1 SDR family oxidoreductase [Brevibacterium sp. LS14]SII22004.1 dehydrogenase [Mycobacteroides abscessus subsp. abscessus]KZE22475.1 3-oxoacyl-ACP reductase [Brevibacterium casei]MCT1446106.1 SDR family oxidoreductase [Brevibacterium casei]MCT1551796.1 SDR family oxidoreductase [Brevibacterium casei]